MTGASVKGSGTSRLPLVEGHDVADDRPQSVRHLALRHPAGEQFYVHLRHSVPVLLETAGATLRDVMTLMRHSDLKLTLRTHGRLQFGHLSRAVRNMPSVLPAVG